MADYVETDADSGGVHINSGIPNRAFALAALDIGGYSWEAKGWYDTMVNGQLSAHAGFESFAQATVTSAGASSRMTRRSPKVEAAWVRSATRYWR